MGQKSEARILLIGDITLFIASLWLTLTLRYFELPARDIWIDHIRPFSLLFAVWILIFIILGLYRKHTVLFKRRLPGTILKAQLVNIALAAIFFFSIPMFGIAPKTNLVIYLIVSSLLISVWRLWIFPKLLGQRTPENALLIGSGDELKELEGEVNNNTYGFTFRDVIDLNSIVNNAELIDRIQQSSKQYGITLIVLDAKDERIVPLLPTLYSRIFDGVRFIDLSRLYEDIFDRIPVSFVKHYWLIDNVALATKKGVHDMLKQLFDYTVAGALGIITLFILPVVYLAIKLDDGGSIFYRQERIGAMGKRFALLKFRSMSETKAETITAVGVFLRKSRIDELPQLWNVLKGELSLIGPRPEMPNYVALYEQHVPYYNTRHLITPGISGWAQIHQDAPPKFGVRYDETTLKLSYDLYYVKNRSTFLDLEIALRTIQTLLSRTGS